MQVARLYYLSLRAKRSSPGLAMMSTLAEVAASRLHRDDEAIPLPTLNYERLLHYVRNDMVAGDCFAPTSRDSR